ncbi:MAG: hypothetical protein DRP42_04605 [Tenericutes bacterium]|nr:MAG: hypothetical protein DRP42_04605 [Mycoplasmatota bacterium]
MTRYDMYAPIEKKKQKITYKQATELVLSMFNDFHPKFGGAAQRVVRENHIHAQILPNKQTGAYCSSPVPGMTPYILISFTDDMSSTRTLAHELGHAIHGILAGKQNYYNFDTPTQICETASIFSELLLQDRLTRDNPKLARPLQAAQLDDAFVAIIREAYITFFEIDAHKMVAEHASVDQLTDRYNQLLKEQFSPAVSVDKKVGYEWLYIQHVFHWPYYCYAYTFGALLALALFAQWKKNPAFADTIVKFLEKGGSESPERMVKAAGFDLKDEKFWQSGFDVIKKMIKEL